MSALLIRHPAGATSCYPLVSCSSSVDCVYAGCYDYSCGVGGGCCDLGGYCNVPNKCYNYGCVPCPEPPRCQMGYYSADGYNRNNGQGGTKTRES